MVDLFTTYAYSCRIGLLIFFTVFRLKNNEKFQQANGQLYAYVANESCTLILLVIEECLFV